VALKLQAKHESWGSHDGKREAQGCACGFVRAGRHRAGRGLADRPLCLMIVAEYRDGVRVFSVPESPALQRGLHIMSERLI
jgi:hypothetical protein